MQNNPTVLAAQPVLTESEQSGGVILEQTKEKCSSLCEFFECGQRKLISKQGPNSQSKKLCGWVGDPCRGSACAYSECDKGRLRQDGSCGLLEKTVPRVSSSPLPGMRREDEANLDVSAIAKPKVLKKLKMD